MIFVLIGILIAVAIILVVIIGTDKDAFEPGYRRAGRQGEAIATEIIKKVLREGDYLFTNIIISFDGKPTELDNVIINSYGVFIVEVKNYKGRLYGEEDDYEWKKFKDDGYGNIFEKRVKNPIKQVKRQVNILAKYLDYYGSHVWIEGYAVLIHKNSPVISKYILSSLGDIDKAIHTPGKNRLSKQQVESIKKLIKGSYEISA